MASLCLLEVFNKYRLSDEHLSYRVTPLTKEKVCRHLSLLGLGPYRYRSYRNAASRIGIKMLEFSKEVMDAVGLENRVISEHQELSPHPGVMSWWLEH